MSLPQVASREEWLVATPSTPPDEANCDQG